MAPFATVLKDQFSMLFFLPFRPQLAEHWKLYLGWGLFITWLVGIGRYWDHPNADYWQHAGLGSVAYVFVISAIIWLIATPLKPENLTYRNILIFVTFTSLPALFYAIPVERFMPMRSAQIANFWFLAIVAAWRVALYYVFLQRVARFSFPKAIIVMLLPLALIVTTLTALNLEHAVFEIMGGIREETANDSAYGLLVLITLFSMFATPLLLIAYAVFVYEVRFLKKQ